MHSSISDLYKRFLDCSKVTIDSRKIEANDCFVALKGTRVDGNQYVQQAIDKGAHCIITEDASWKDHSNCYFTSDSLATLQALARHHRDQFECPIIAITGSNGKTTTKELIGTVLSHRYRCHVTQGNFNNHIGVPLTLLAMPKDTEIAVIEMGANHKGEIHDLCLIAHPTHGLITNIGKAHLEGFGGIEGVKIGKSELYKYLAAHNGTVFLNEDEPTLPSLISPTQRRVGYRETTDFNAQRVGFDTIKMEDTPYLKIAFLDDQKQPLEIQTQLWGAYNFHNIMTALCVGRYFKVPSHKIKEAICVYKSDNNRSQEVQWGRHKVIMDAYNANPTSMEQALRAFASSQGDSKIAIIGDMLEMGIYAEEEHQKIVDLANTLPIQQVIAVGQHFSSLQNLGKVKTFDTLDHLLSEWSWAQVPDSYILLKGSRGIALEKIIAHNQ